MGAFEHPPQTVTRAVTATRPHISPVSLLEAVSCCTPPSSHQKTNIADGINGIERTRPQTTPPHLRRPPCCLQLYHQYLRCPLFFTYLLCLEGRRVTTTPQDIPSRSLRLRVRRQVPSIYLYEPRRAGSMHIWVQT